MDMDINAKLAFRLMKIMKEISSLVDDKLKLEKKILDKNLERDENGDPVLATDDSGDIIPGAVKVKDSESFNRAMFELMNIEIEVGYEKIDFDDLNLETIKVKELMQIEFLFN
jgi:hypothetical protein